MEPANETQISKRHPWSLVSVARRKAGRERDGYLGQV